MSVDPKAPIDDYIGEPGSPDPWTTKRPLEGLRDTDAARVVCTAPDVCLTPVGSSVVPVPYQIHGLCGHDENYTPSVRFTGQKAMVMRSKTSHCHGDAPGVRKGVVSGTVEDVSEPVGHAAKVRAEGSEVIRHLDRFKMNSGNTVGEAQFVRDTRTYEPPTDDDPVLGSLVMTDAMPEPVILNAQYAQALPAPQPGLPQPSPPPTVGQPGNVIQGPWQPKPPPQPPNAPATWLGRLGRFSALGLLTLMGPSTPIIPFPTSDMDETERALNDRARSLLSPDQGYNTKVQQWYYEQLEAYRQQRATQGTQANQAPAVVPDNVRVDEDEQRRRCIVGPYDTIKNLCAAGSQAHHIVPDFTLRYGTRAEGMRGEKRIPNMPSFGNGPSICVTGNARVSGTEHNQAHAADSAIQALGASNIPPNTAPIGQVIPLAVAEAIRAKPQCAAEITAAVTTGFAGTHPSQLARTRQSRPLPSGATLEALRTGQRAGNFGAQ